MVKSDSFLIILISAVLMAVCVSTLFLIRLMQELKMVKEEFDLELVDAQV